MIARKEAALTRSFAIVLAVFLAGLVEVRIAHAVPASSLIVPGGSIGLIRLGDDSGQVRQKWGRPNRVQQPERGYEMWQYDKLLATVHLRNRRVVQIQTSSPVFRTSRGIGPGSSRVDLIKSYGASTWIDNLGPITILTYAGIGLVVSFRNDDPTYIAGVSIVEAPISR